MTTKLYAIESAGFNPYANLALEELLFARAPADARVLYLWQNEKTVVLGRNQDAEAECNIEALRRYGGTLARRASGGGAVYHDLGNLNFSFICDKKDEDVRRDCAVIISALKEFGIEAEISGRNDMEAGGRKFSGSAYQTKGSRALHHGTLMLSVDASALQSLLTVSPDKLQKRAVPSVRARVVNLCELNPAVTVEGLKQALLRAFSAEFGGEALPLPPPDQSEINALAFKYASPEWLCGREKPRGRSARRRFPFGGVTAYYTIDHGIIADCQLYSDALDTDMISALPAKIVGRTANDAGLLGNDPENEIIRWICEEAFK